MKSSLLLREFESRVVFDTGAVRAIAKNDGSYANLILHRLKRSGHVFEIERNKYTVHRDAFLVASRISWPSYISMWSALRYHNLTEQIPHHVWVVTTRKRRNSKIEFADTTISFICTKPKYFFGFEKEVFRGFEIFVADPEKSIIDSILFRRISISEIFYILRENIKSYSVGRLVRYAVRTGNKALVKRLGFILDKLGYDHSKRFKNHIYASYTPLEPNLPPKGLADEKWKVVDNIRR